MAKYLIYDNMLSAHISTIFLPGFCPDLPPVPCLLCELFRQLITGDDDDVPSWDISGGAAGECQGREVICHYAALDLGRERGNTIMGVEIRRKWKSGPHVFSHNRYRNSCNE